MEEGGVTCQEIMNQRISDRRKLIESYRIKYMNSSSVASMVNPLSYAKRMIEIFLKEDFAASRPHLSQRLQKGEDGMVDVLGLLECIGMKWPDDEDSVKERADFLRTSKVLKVSEDGKRVGRRAESGKLEAVKPQESTSDVPATNVTKQRNRVKLLIEASFTEEPGSNISFLSKMIQASEDGMVDISLLLSLDSIKQRLGFKCAAEKVDEDTVKAMVDLLRTSKVLKVSEDGKWVGRKTESVKLEVAKPQESSSAVPSSCVIDPRLYVKQLIEDFLNDKALAQAAVPILSRMIRESEDGMVDVSWFLSFSSIKRRLGFECDDEEVDEDTINAMVDLLRTSKVLKVSEDGKKVGCRAEYARLEGGETTRGSQKTFGMLGFW